MHKQLSILIFLLLTACATLPPPCPKPPQGDVVYVTARGWHAELGIPIEELKGPLAQWRKTFAGARVIMVGYGKETFMTAPDVPMDRFGEYVIGPVPGPAVIHAVGLSVTPLEAYEPGEAVVLALPPGGSEALSQYLWDELAKEDGKPRVVAPSDDPAGLFYAAQSEYNLGHTCNRWAAEALHAAGLPIAEDGIIFAGQVTDSVSPLARQQCQAP